MGTGLDAEDGIPGRRELKANYGVDKEAGAVEIWVIEIELLVDFGSDEGALL